MSPVFSFRRSDAALVRQALAQQPEAFDALVVRHQRQAHAIARAVGARASAVDDVVQQAFLQAFRGLRGLRQPANFGPWLLSIVRNTARNHLRDEHRAPACSGGGAAEDYLNLQAAPPASEPVEVRELRELLWRQVAELPDGIREAIQLFYHEGESVREVARALQISVTAAKQRLKRGRDVLREDLWRELEESLRDMLPGAREWERKARALSLLLFAAVPASWSRATLAAAASSPTSLSSASVTCSHGLLPTIFGGLTVTGKKLALSFSLALLFVAGGLLVMMRLPQESPEGATTKASSNTAVVARATTPRVSSNSSSENTGLGDPLAAGRGTAAAAEDALPIAIEGRVTSDGHGVASARIVALQLTSWSAISHTADDEIDLEKRLARLREACDQLVKNVPQARSGLDGAFSFRGLPAGDYRLFTSHADYLPDANVVVTVVAGAAQHQDVELTKGEKITGKVVDSVGKPVAGATVNAETIETALLRGRNRDLKRILDLAEGLSFLDEVRAESGGDGSFTLTGVTPGVHSVRASRPGFLSADPVQAAGGAHDVLVRLRAGASIVGRVVDLEKKPLAGAKVSSRAVRLTEVHRIFDWSGNEEEKPEDALREAVTDAGGRFRLEALDARAHDLTVTADPYAPLYREVDAAEGEVDLGDILLEKGLTIRGLVFDPQQRPCARARVSASRPERSVRAGNSIPRLARAAVREATTDSQGKFELHGLPSGKIDLRAEADDLGAAVLSGIEAGAKDVTLTLGVGNEIHGKVTDAATGAAVVGAEIEIGFTDPKTERTDDSGEFVVLGFVLERNHRGMTSMRVTHRDYAPYIDMNTFVLGSTESSPIEIRLSTEGEVHGRVAGPDGAPIQSAQVWLESLNPVPGGGVSLGESRTTTDAEGRFRLAEPQSVRYAIGEIKVNVVASHPGFAFGRAGPFGVPRTGAAWPEVEIALAKGVILEGRITQAEGAPISGARVSVRAASPRGTGSAPDLAMLLTTRTAFSGKDGKYRVAALEPGQVDVEAVAPGFAQSRVTALNLAGETTQQDFILERGASIRGRVVDSAGAPIAGAEVTAVSEDAEAGAKDAIQGPGGSSFAERMRVRSSVGLLLALTDERGGFELANLSEGSYTVLARASGYEEAKRTGVRAGEEVKDIPLSRFSAVRGTAREASTGRPIPAFTVYAINKARRSAEKESSDWRVGSEGDLKFVDPAGRFFFDGLRPGEYEVIVYASSFLAHHEDVKLAAGEEVSLDVKLNQGARIEGVVTDAESGLPIEGVQVSGTRQIPQEEFDAMMKKGRVSPPMTPLSGSAEATSGADGAFVLDGLLPGEYAVWAWHPYFVLVYDNSNRTQLEALGTAMVAVRMRLTGRVEGDVSGLRVAAGNGLLMGHRLVFEKLRGEKTPEAEKSQTERWGTGLDPAGHFHAENLRPGQFRISVKSQAYREGKFIELTPGGGIGQRESVGREETTALGEVEVRAGETTRFRGSVK